ncbi:MAG: LLM class flavin-dependent oxidoreductase [Acidimicrobiaceae bacterium]|nr:LLM class flavin-dependent oxidoreductase [Acidimicrobiaceae bacterium]
MRLSTVILPVNRWTQASAMWRQADEYGLHAAYTYDHLSWRSFRERDWFTMVPTLAAAATLTNSIRLGPLVSTPNFRHPLLLAKDLAALDDISQGRVLIGLGSGGTGYDATVLGEEPMSRAARHRRFAEFARALDHLLRVPVGNLDGPWYRVVDSRQIPGTVQLPRPPIYLSALGPQSLALAAEIADGWVSIGSATGGRSTYESVSDQIVRLDEQLATRGRARESIDRILLNFEGDERPLQSFESFLDWAGRYHELGLDEVVVHWPIADSSFDSDRSLFERVATEGREILATWGR